MFLSGKLNRRRERLLRSGLSAFALSLAFGVNAFAQSPQGVESSDQVRSDVVALEARALLQLGEYQEAEAAANEALTIDPDNIEALRVLAEIAEQGEDRSEMRQRWGRVRDVARNDQERFEVARRIRELSLEEGSHVSAQAYYLGDSGNDEQYGVRAEGRYVDASALGYIMAVEVRRFEADDSAGGLRGTLPIEETKLRGEIGAVLDRGEQEWSAALVASEDAAGLRVGVERQIRNGAAGLRAEANTPYWVYSRGAQNGAALDAVTAYVQQYDDAFGWDGAVSLRNYTVDGRDEVGQSLQVAGGVSARLLPGETAPRVDGRVDAEWFTDVEERLSSDGVLIADLPLVDREVLSLGLSKPFMSRSRNGHSAPDMIEVGAGYRKDLQGEDGPYVRMSGSLGVIADTRLNLSAEYSDVAAERQSTDGYTSVFLTLIRRFPVEGAVE